MKKLIALVLCLMFCVASVGVAESDQLVVATVVKAIGSNWFDSMDWEGTRWAEEHGAEMHYIGPTEMDSAAQLQSLDDAIALQPDILTVVPIAADACDAVLAGAREQGTIVVSHEGSTLTNIDYNVDAFNNQEFGEMFAKKAVELYGEEFTYAVITSTLSTPAHMEWCIAFYNYLSTNYPNTVCVNDMDGEEVVPLEGGTNADLNYTATKQLLQAHPELQVILGSNSSGVPGICRAVEELGMNENCKVLAVGSASGHRDYYLSGTIPFGAFWYPGYAQYAAFQVGLRVINGEPIESGMDLGVEGYNNVTVDGKNVYGQAWLEVTAENVDEMAEML